MLKLKINGCIHLPKEVRLKKEGVAPYICPIANHDPGPADREIEVRDDLPGRLDINEKTKECTVIAAIYETPEKIGEVSDWTKE